MEWQPPDKSFDEIFQRDGALRSHYEQIHSVLAGMSDRELRRRERLQMVSLLNQGITFAVSGGQEGVERVFPFDFVPRVVTATEWARIEEGLVQRVNKRCGLRTLWNFMTGRGGHEKTPR